MFPMNWCNKNLTSAEAKQFPLINLKKIKEIA